jgi:hypothetical protein
MPNPQNPIFPAGVAADINLTVAANRALSYLTFSIDGSQTQFTVVDGTKYNAPCLVQIDTEIILVGSISGNVMMSCTRGYNLTSPTSHGQNAPVKGYVLAYHHNQIAAEIKAIEAGLGANFGNVVMQNDQAGGSTIGGLFSNLYLKPNGVTAGTYGGFNRFDTITVDATGRITSIEPATGNINYPVFYKGAIFQGSNAVLGFSFGLTNAPNAVPYTGTNGEIYAVAAFTAGNNYWVQDHFYWPDDWVGDTVSLDIYWRTAATTGTVTWQCQTGYISPGSTDDFTFGSIASITTTVPGVADTIVKSRITPLFLGSLQPGDEFFFKFARSAGDTAAADAEMISIKFNIHRDFALGS